jgi:hypothetical protein
MAPVFGFALEILDSTGGAIVDLILLQQEVHIGEMCDPLLGRASPELSLVSEIFLKWWGSGAKWAFLQGQWLELNAALRQAPARNPETRVVEFPFHLFMHGFNFSSYFVPILNAIDVHHNQEEVRLRMDRHLRGLSSTNAIQSYPM